jgi:predicted polyphosphate/ATP-dependent NAD kinase
MGAEALDHCGLRHHVVGRAQGAVSVAADTTRAVALLKALQVDLVLFAGGDGTARDVFDALGSDTPVLGIPAGVKMHSGVFAVSPEAAGELLLELMEPGRTYLVGPGSTTATIMARLGLANTLLGVDAIRDGKLLATDMDEAALLEQLAASPVGAAILVTVIGGQGHVFGRGNQQFSPTVIRTVGLDNIYIVAAKSKIAALQGRPLLVDTNDPQLDRELCGWRSVITGYDDRILYRIAAYA